MGEVKEENYMPGTIRGGQKAADTNRKKYGKDFYARIGAKGGKLGTTGGFAANRELARIAGAKGGRISRRRKAEMVEIEVATQNQNIEAQKNALENSTQKDLDLAA